MLNVVLFEPEIPHNTGEIIRLCANTGFGLHLIKPLGFALDDRKLKRVGLDYHEFAALKVYDNIEQYFSCFAGSAIFACTTYGAIRHDQCQFQPGDTLLFGPETRGLPVELRENHDLAHRLKIPMRAESRSLNLANSVSIVVYEAWRQLGFCGAV